MKSIENAVNEICRLYNLQREDFVIRHTPMYIWLSQITYPIVDIYGNYFLKDNHNFVFIYYKNRFLLTLPLYEYGYLCDNIAKKLYRKLYKYTCKLEKI